jgi:hypothetical protein
MPVVAAVMVHGETSVLPRITGIRMDEGGGEGEKEERKRRPGTGRPS